MSLLDRIFIGKVIKDFGVLEEKSLIIGKIKKSMFLAERRGKLKIAFKWSGYAAFGASVTYFDLKAESIPKLAEPRTVKVPYPPFDRLRVNGFFAFCKGESSSIR